MKKTNKGFSLVELIIVIAIMAILAGALAPALIKYINKSRISSAISNGQQIASAVQTALSNESAYDDANDVGTTEYSAFLTSCDTSTNKNFRSAIESVIGTNVADPKVKKDMKSNSSIKKKYYVKLDVASNIVEVYVGLSDSDHMVYPNVGNSWTD